MGEKTEEEIEKEIDEKLKKITIENLVFYTLGERYYKLLTENNGILWSFVNSNNSYEEMMRDIEKRKQEVIEEIGEEAGDDLLSIYGELEEKYILELRNVLKNIEHVFPKTKIVDYYEKRDKRGKIITEKTVISEYKEDVPIPEIEEGMNFYRTISKDSFEVYAMDEGNLNYFLDIFRPVFRIFVKLFYLNRKSYKESEDPGMYVETLLNKIEEYNSKGMLIYKERVNTSIIEFYCKLSNDYQYIKSPIFVPYRDTFEYRRIYDIMILSSNNITSATNFVNLFLKDSTQDNSLDVGLYKMWLITSALLTIVAELVTFSNLQRDLYSGKTTFRLNKYNLI